MDSSQSEFSTYILESVDNLNSSASLNSSDNLNSSDPSDNLDNADNLDNSAINDKNKTIKKQARKQTFIEVGTELTIMYDEPTRLQPSLQMTLLFNMFWIDRTMAENILLYLGQTYAKFPIIFRHLSDQNDVNQKNKTKYIAVSLAVTSRDTAPKLQQIKQDQQITQNQQSQQDQQKFLTPISLKNTVQIKIQHFKFAVIEENGVLILTNPSGTVKFRDLYSLTDREIFGTAEFYKSCKKLRDELRQRFGCFC